MTTSTQWQLAKQAAERYQSILVPTILGPFAEALVDFANLQPGEIVVDVGCGTGAATRPAAVAVGSSGQVTGIDLNQGMLEVAQSLPEMEGVPVTWRQASATDLPLDDQSIHAVLCAQTLQFLPEKEQALTEIARSLKPGGRAAFSLWTAMADSPYFYALVTAINDYIDASTANGLKSAFSLTDSTIIGQLLQKAGFTEITISEKEIALPLPDLSEFIPRHISATPMAAGFNQATKQTQQQIIETVIDQVRHFDLDGAISVPFRSYLIMGYK